MRFLPFLLSILAVSCAQKAPLVVRIESTPSRVVKAGGNLRFSERIKAYPLGRYTEPNHRGVMHEAHTIYRIEATPKWNLDARAKTPPPMKSAAHGAGLSPNELRVELSRQREATREVIQSGQAVSSKLTELATSLQKSQQALAEQNATIRKDLEATRGRLESLEEKADKQPEHEAPAGDAPW